MEIRTVKVNDVKVGNYIYVNDKVYKVVSIDKAKVGKHGAAKARIEAIGLDGSKIVIVKPTQDPIEIPMIEKKKAQVLSLLSDSVALVMDNETYETYEAYIDEKLRGKIKENQTVVVWDVGEKIIMQAFNK